MKKLIVLLSFVLIINETKAQYVTIPDANFVAYLQQNFPGCMSGNQMDTSCAGITGATYLTITSANISDLTGVRYFDNVTILNCGWNHLTILPALPPNLIQLKCQYNYITNIANLPNGITSLECFNNHLTSITNLPNSLQSLTCYNNQLINLPILPNGLQILECSGNLLTTLPVLPNSISELYCASNQLTSLPTLSLGLTNLNCSSNLLTSLPALPYGLSMLNCYVNQLTTLPSLPATVYFISCAVNQITVLPSLSVGLSELDCSENLLTTLPALPSQLQSLFCWNNQLTVLPALNSNLSVLLCYNNQLTSIPSLPASMNDLEVYNNQLTSLPTLNYGLEDLYAWNNNISCFPKFPPNLIYGCTIYNNPFTCLPNYCQGMDTTTLAYPLCTPFTNSNGCANAEGITGFTYLDSNGNCLKDAGDIGKTNVHLYEYDSIGNLLSQSYSFTNGTYFLDANAGNTYNILMDTIDSPYHANCLSPGVSATVLANPLVQNLNFDVACKQGFDLGIQSIYASGIIFPGQPFTLLINSGDMSHWYNMNCASGIGGTVQVTVSGLANYIGPALGALTPVVAGNIYTYNVADFGSINNSTAFNLNFTTDTTAVLTDSIYVTVTITPAISGDYNNPNNSFVNCFYIQNSFDPNYKETYPINVPEGFRDYFIYTIHFQNTGNASAINIRVLDSLSSHLDLETFQLINYSHQPIVSLTGNLLTVLFKNINLQDSTSNEQASKGFFQYRIKPKGGLASGTQIYNTANIYFDYNAPIRTNTSINTFVRSELNENDNNQEIIIYPNPGSGKFIIKLPNGTDVSKLSFEITNLLGETIYQSEVHTPKSEINLINQPSGIYFVRIIGGTQSLNQKIVKE